MDTDYAFEVACDAITQLALTFVELETILKEHNYQKAEQLIAQRPKAGRKASSCFLSHHLMILRIRFISIPPKNKYFP